MSLRPRTPRGNAPEAIIAPQEDAMVALDAERNTLIEELVARYGSTDLTRRTEVIDGREWTITTLPPAMPTEGGKAQIRSHLPKYRSQGKISPLPSMGQDG